MSRPTFEELVTSFNELMDALEKSKREAEAELTAAKEEEESYNECSENTEPSMTPLETLISDRINKHINAGTFPTLEEAQAIYILDFINYRYNR